jgi:hypothetical protein
MLRVPLRLFEQAVALLRRQRVLLPGIAGGVSWFGQ